LSLSADLLAQARALAEKEPKKPKQASLRRAVSAAYFSLFHLLTEDAAQSMFPGNDVADLRAVVRRAFDHARMKKAAKGFGSANPSEVWKELLSSPSPQLQTVAQAFVELQEARHQADYDVRRPLTRSEVTAHVDRADAAIEAWKSIRKVLESKGYSAEARTFLAALLVYDQASRA